MGRERVRRTGRGESRDTTSIEMSVMGGKYDIAEEAECPIDSRHRMDRQSRVGLRVPETAVQSTLHRSADASNSRPWRYISSEEWAWARRGRGRKRAEWATRARA